MIQERYLNEIDSTANHLKGTLIALTVLELVLGALMIFVLPFGLIGTFLTVIVLIFGFIGAYRKNKGFLNAYGVISIIINTLSFVALLVMAFGIAVWFGFSQRSSSSDSEWPMSSSNNYYSSGYYPSSNPYYPSSGYTPSYPYNPSSFDVYSSNTPTSSSTTTASSSAYYFHEVKSFLRHVTHVPMYHGHHGHTHEIPVPMPMPAPQPDLTNPELPPVPGVPTPQPYPPFPVDDDDKDEEDKHKHDDDNDKHDDDKHEHDDDKHKHDDSNNDYDFSESGEYRFRHPCFFILVGAITLILIFTTLALQISTIVFSLRLASKLKLQGFYSGLPTNVNGYMPLPPPPSYGSVQSGSNFGIPPPPPPPPPPLDSPMLYPVIQSMSNGVPVFIMPIPQINSNATQTKPVSN